MGFLFLKVPHETARLLQTVEVPGNKQPIDEMHITLLYMGKGQSIIDVAKAMVAAYEVTSKQPPFLASVKQISSFPANPDDGVPIICPVESPELVTFRANLAAQFDRLGLNYSKKYEYHPHVTISYITDPEKQKETHSAPLPQPISWLISDMSIWSGDRGEGPAAISMPFTLKPLAQIAARIAGVTSD
jgi:2'-5' RNA ligase